MRFVLIKAFPEDHLYSVFERSLAQALREIGHEAVITNQERSFDRTTDRASAADLLEVLKATRFDAAISFGSFFAGAKFINGLSIYDGLGVKFVGWLFDHPVYSPQSLDRAVQGRNGVYSNHNHLRYAQATGLPGRGRTLLPGVDPAPGRPKDYGARDRSIFVAATCREEPRRIWETEPDSPGRQLVTGVVERLLADREACLLDAVDQTSVELGLGFQYGRDPGLDAAIGHLVRTPLTYVRNMDRLRIIEALADAGLPMTICGSGWKDRLGPRKTITYLDSVPFAALPELYGQARVVLNLNAGNGAGERTFQAAMSGAASLSDYSGLLDAFFGDGEGISFFDRADPSTVVEAAGRLIETDLGEELAAAGHRKVQEAGLWRHRAEELAAWLA